MEKKRIPELGGPNFIHVCIMKHNFRQNIQTQSFLLSSFSCLNLTSAPSVGHSGMSTVIEQQQQ